MKTFVKNDSFKIYRTNPLTRKDDCIGRYSNQTLTVGGVTVTGILSGYYVESDTKIMREGKPCFACEVYATTTEGVVCRVLVSGCEESHPTVKKEATVDDILEIEDDMEEMP